MTTTSQLSFGRRLVLNLCLLLFGTLAGLALGEGAVRVTGVIVADDPYVQLGRVAPFFTPVRVDGVPYYQVAHRAIYRERNIVFPVRKRPGTFRVFCVGSSASAGWPHPANEIYSAYLREALQQAYPQRQIEVINMSAHAYAAYRSRLIFKQVVSLEADLVIVYAGNNEFLERRSYQVGTRWYDPLERVVNGLRLFRLVRGNSWLFDDALGTGRPQHVRLEQWSLIGQAVNDLRADSIQFQLVQDHYAYSIRAMIRLAEQKGVPVALVTVPVNLRDWQPNVSIQTATGPELKRWAEAFQTGRAALLHDSAALAVQRLREAAALGPTHATTQFYLGRALEAAGQFDEAYASYDQARDLDHSPVRAISAFNVILRDIARNNANVILVDAERAFRESAAPRAPGFDLFLDYVHPTKRGNLLLAEEVFDAIVQHRLVADDAPAIGFSHHPELTDGKPYDERRDFSMQVTLLRLEMVMHQYESALMTARLVEEDASGLATVPQGSARMVRGAYELLPEVLAVERQEVLGPGQEPTLDRALVEEKLQSFYRRWWPGYKQSQWHRQTETVSATGLNPNP